MANQPIRTLTVQARTAGSNLGTEGWHMNGDIHVVALVRGEEQYIFMFDEVNRTETLRMLGRYAADPQLSFSWYDAAVLSQKVRELLPAKKIQTAASSNPTSVDQPSSMSDQPYKTSTKPPRFKLD